MNQEALVSLDRTCYYCQRINFLPIRCNQCRQDFCDTHRSLEAHECPTLALLAVNHRPREPPGSSLAPSTSSATPVQTLSEPQGVQNVKNAKAKALLARNFKASSGQARPKTRSRDVPAGAKTQSPALKLMLLHQRAIAADSKKKAGDVPLAERIHFYFSVDADAPDGNSRPYWLSRDTSAGRALDLLASLCGVKNENAQSTSGPDQKLQLWMSTQGQEDRQLAPASATLAQLNVKDGCALALSTGERLPVVTATASSCV